MRFDENLKRTGESIQHLEYLEAEFQEEDYLEPEFPENEADFEPEIEILEEPEEEQPEQEAEEELQEFQLRRRPDGRTE